MSGFADPAYWRHFAPSGRWSSIDCTVPRCVPPEDYLELQEMLRGIVPRTTFRDGLEVWEGVFKLFSEITDADEPDEKARQELQWAARNLETVTHLIEATMAQEAGSEDPPFAEAVAEAVNVLKDNGMIYEGWTDTHLFKDLGTGGWRSVPSEKAAAIAEELELMPADRKKAWLDEDPRRRLNTLANLWSMKEVFRSIAGSKLWHAIRILGLEHEFMFATAVICPVGMKRVPVRAVNTLVDVVARIAVQIGLSHQSINKKAAEYDAVELRRRDEKAGAKGSLANEKNRARRERAYAYLDARASKVSHFVKLNLAERIGKAQKWAADHDEGQVGPDCLFRCRGALFRPSWFEDWNAGYGERVLRARV
jgi:hypothetical protein